LQVDRGGLGFPGPGEPGGAVVTNLTEVGVERQDPVEELDCLVETPLVGERFRVPGDEQHVALPRLSRALESGGRTFGVAALELRGPIRPGVEGGPPRREIRVPSAAGEE